MEKLINIDETVPNEYFIFIERTNFITHHNLTV